MKHKLAVLYYIIAFALIAPLFPNRADAATAPPYAFSPDWRYDQSGRPEYTHYYGWQVFNFYANHSEHKIEYWLEPGTQTYFDHAWNTWQPEMFDWQKKISTSNESTANLRIYKSACPPLSAALGCVIVDSYKYYSFIDAWYSEQTSFYINFNNVATSAERKLVAVHEFGHVLGLADRYEINSDGCYTSEDSIMDAAYWDGNKYVICDPGVNPTTPRAIDRTRIETYWSNGAFKKRQDYSGKSIKRNGDILTHKWNDYSWSELHMKLYYYYWNDNSQLWIQYNDWWALNRVHGGHAATDDRPVEISFDAAAWGGPHGTTQRVCNRPTYGFDAANNLVEGKFWCSDSIYYP